MKKWSVVFYFTVLLLLCSKAHAYLDPGNNSMMLQLLLGGTAGMGVILKMYWQKIMGVFQLTSKKDS